MSADATRHVQRRLTALVHAIVPSHGTLTRKARPWQHQSPTKLSQNPLATELYSGLITVVASAACRVLGANILQTLADGRTCLDASIAGMFTCAL